MANVFQLPLFSWRGTQRLQEIATFLSPSVGGSEAPDFAKNFLRNVRNGLPSTTTTVTTAPANRSGAFSLPVAGFIRCVT